MTAADAQLGAGSAAAPDVDPRIHVASQFGRQGRYAGIVSRTVAIAADAVLLAVCSVGTLFVIQAVLAMIEGVPFGDISIEPEWGIAIVVGQSAIYFTAAWAVFGRTCGEALVGLRLVKRNGGDVGWGQAFVRFVVSPLAYAFCGLGWIWIVVDNRRRAWPDIIARTVVVYDWRRADPVEHEVIEPHA